jgi:hypothetical protein
MTFIFEKDTYALNFFHYRDRVVERDMTRCTVSKLVDGSDPVLIAFGTAICNPQDNFSRRVGKTTAFHYALEGLRYNYKSNFTANQYIKFRVELWHQFVDMMNGRIEWSA